MGDPDAHRNALRQPHPGVNRINILQGRGAGAAFETLMPRVTLSTRPMIGSRYPSALLRRGRRRRMGHLGFLEIAVDPVTVGVDHRDIGRARGHSRPPA